MKVTPTPPGTGHKRIPYADIVTNYNKLEVGKTALELDKVYNISLFKQRLVRRGVVEDVDFQAYNRDGHTYLKRLTNKRMSEE